MVKAADIEALFKKYIEENSIERADALYLLYAVGKENAAKTLRIRYGISAPLSSVIEDLKRLNIEPGESLKLEDTGEYIGDAVKSAFNYMCLRKILENVEKIKENLSREAKNVLYTIKEMDKLDISVLDHIELAYYLLFKDLHNEFKDIPLRNIIENALNELVRYHILYLTSYLPGYGLTPYWRDVLNILKDEIPEIEIKVHYKQKEVPR